MREPNAVDFWRGVALVTIFVNHIPGNTFQRFTYSQFSISDAAELFVFLAGWSIALATGGAAGAAEPLGRTMVRLASRTVEVYRAQLVITAIALAMIAGAALLLDNPLLLEWHNAGPVFGDPIQTTVGWVTLSHQLGYFNILPLYVALLALSGPMVMLARVSRGLLLGLSLALYGLCLIGQINIPTWPLEGHWFFNPLCWQLLMVLGFLCRDGWQAPRWRAFVCRLRPLGVLGVVAGVVLTVMNIRPDPLSVPEPRLLFTFDKSYLAPARLLHFLAVIVAFQGLFALAEPWIRPLARAFSGLGRNSLAVFSVASLASLAAQLIRFWQEGGIILDILVVGCGLIALVFTAWFVEWRSRSPRPSLSG